MGNLFDIQTLIWLFPIIFVFHDFEEIIMLESWIAKSRDKIKKALPIRMANKVLEQFSMTTAQMAAAVLIVFLFVSSSTFMASQYVTEGAGGSIRYFIVVVLVFFIHVFTHAGQSILFNHSRSHHLYFSNTALQPHHVECITGSQYHRLGHHLNLSAICVIGDSDCISCPLDWEESDLREHGDVLFAKQRVRPFASYICGEAAFLQTEVNHPGILSLYRPFQCEQLIFQ